MSEWNLGRIVNSVDIVDSAERHLRLANAVLDLHWEFVDIVDSAERQLRLCQEP